MDLQTQISDLQDDMRKHQHTGIDKTTRIPGASLRANITMQFGQFFTAGLTQNVTIFNLPAFAEIISAWAYVPTAFAGTLTTTISVGITGAETVILTAQDVKTTGFKRVIGADLTTNRAVYSASVATPIVARATSTVNNLSLLTAGTIKIVLTYTLPDGN